MGPDSKPDADFRERLESEARERPAQLERRRWLACNVAERAHQGVGEVPLSKQGKHLFAAAVLDSFTNEEAEQLHAAAAAGDESATAALLAELEDRERVRSKRRGQETYIAFGTTRTAGGVKILVGHREVRSYGPTAAGVAVSHAPAIAPRRVARGRESHGSRHGGTRRVASRSAGGGSSGDDPDESDPALGRDAASTAVLA